MDEPAATDTDVSAALSEVLRLTTALADRVLTDLVAGQTLEKSQSEALWTAVRNLRGQGVSLPSSLERTIQEISQRAIEAIKRARESPAGPVSWTFGRLRGRQRIVLAKPKPSPGPVKQP